MSICSSYACNRIILYEELTLRSDDDNDDVGDYILELIYMFKTKIN